ncbi:MAG TPA: hypothetical protein VNU94_09245 [Acidobacteriaceae bacterium]|nr:hypothetical protein [Acidobacteriaceae bacterium]
MSIRSTHRILKMVLAAAALVATGTLTGCAGFWQPVTTTTTNNTGTGFDLVYAGKNDSNEFVGYAVLSTGLTAVTGSPFSLPSPPLSMAINPADTFLYVGTATGIYGYSIAAGGSLSILNGGSYIANSPNALAPVSAMDISPDGNWLVVLNDTAGGIVNVITYQITPSTGVLTYNGDDTPVNLCSTALFPSGCSTTESDNATNSVAQAIKFAPDENTQTTSVLAASLGTGGEMTLTFNSTNGITAFAELEQPNSTTVQDNGVAWASNSDTLYFTRGGSDEELVFYGVNPSTGGFTTTAQTGPSLVSNPTALSFNSNQSYLYVTNAPSASTGSISGFSISPNSGSPSSFTALSGVPYSTSGTEPNAIAFDNSDTYMLVLNETGPPDLIQYTIDGVLDPTTSTLGRLYVNSSVNTTLISTGGSGPEVTMAVSH